jgi:hypothetical protein
MVYSEAENVLKISRRVGRTASTVFCARGQKRGARYNSESNGFLSREALLAPKRLRTLDGARPGLLDNSKLNAADLLAALGELLKERYAIKSVTARTKGHGFSSPVKDRNCR